MAAFETPRRFIFNASDLTMWQGSQACADFVGFIGAVNVAVRGKSSSSPCAVNETLGRVIAMLRELAVWIDEIKPIVQPMRYGNKAFRLWHARLAREGAHLCRGLLPADKAGAAVELLPYLYDSFGNATRIDYGTGHETTFMMILYCLAKLDLIAPADLEAVGTKVFPVYMETVRKLQQTYWLEPAGSHGVWSLDDYHFLVFLFGSSQLQGHAHIRPRSALNAEVRESCARDFMYLGAIEAIVRVKAGAPFSEHSPILHDIAALPSWAKANEGLLKMYRGEVLGKLPVAQHFVFGSLFPAAWPPSREPVVSESMAHATALTAGAEGGAAAAAAAALEALTVAESVPADAVTHAVAPWLTSPPHAAGAAACGGDGGAPAQQATAAAGALAASGAAGVARGGDGSAAPPSAAAAAAPHEGGAAQQSGAPVGPVGDGVVAFLDAFGAAPLQPLER